MLDREACERRVYRLATLLTGDADVATRVIEAVVGARPDLRSLDDAHMDRLTILRARELAGRPSRRRAGAAAAASAPRPGPLPPADVAAALAALPAQPREAWILSRVYRLPPRDAARAMDCSITATGRHLERAESALRRALGPRADVAAAELLDHTLALDVPRVYRLRRERRRRLRLARRVIVVVAILAALAVAWWWWRGHVVVPAAP